MTERITALDDPTTFYSGPIEFLVAKVAQRLLAVPQFALVFGTRIDPYQRMDYSLRETPALRIYNHTWIKEFESWFLVGELLLDVIFPASIRRTLEQQYQDTIVAALCQQFRRNDFFVALCNDVPGLNELGKEFSVDKSLGFAWGSGSQEPAPLTQIRLNFRLDLRIWDEFLTSDDRTKNDPFEKTLGNMTFIHTIISGKNDDNSTNVVVTSDQDI